MRSGSTLSFVVLVGCLSGCAASARGDVAAAELQARAARAEAMREHTRLLGLEAKIVELERRLAARARACETTPDPLSVDVPPARERPKTEPLRSEGDFMAEAHVVAPAADARAATAAVAAATPTESPASDREQLQQALEGLREYAFNRQGGLSLERREALRVLLRHERQLDLQNPWTER